MKLISRDYLHLPLCHQTPVCLVFGHKPVGRAIEVGLLPQGMCLHRTLVASRK